MGAGGAGAGGPDLGGGGAGASGVGSHFGVVTAGGPTILGGIFAGAEPGLETDGPVVNGLGAAFGTDGAFGAATGVADDAGFAGT